jgi:Geranylgeranyl pyrophosphate synthase
MHFVKEHNGIDYALSVSKDYSIKAKNYLDIFPDSQTKSALNSLVDFVAERKINFLSPNFLSKVKSLNRFA